MCVGDCLEERGGWGRRGVREKAEEEEEEVKEEREEDHEKVEEEEENEEEKEEKKKVKEEGMYFPSSSLSASNTSFVGCYRSQNVAISGSEGNPSKPARQNQTDDGANSFTWCVWNGTKTTGTSNSYTDGVSSGGAINMYNKASGTVSVKFCSFNDCNADFAEGEIMCYIINSVKIENNSFNACSAQNRYGGGMYVNSISSCVNISGCKFQKCKAYCDGGRFFLSTFQVSGAD
ncbi:uncharacterized protein MONOS_6050 [Monocercomonoides exilis]|uniref:uncharacterized protein n=1 Tax=Monocercomonoides exilis TaxID=2049356 RepID=UPI00355AA147|nr:hypothetical protein MONOS_6050 [Monocercomonoides exilis]|eukprot:MONOS_6050.1-p1 / transcript=MONOS_6050.1 / gene=MONOS_6050 / organism=Monocercomonoides_exilis_PA203 / gene_product=unspecified product / transcript_product=unspecified product / location=Mono_scaffold00185:77467-78398(-) / protein_length=233 / sequence_SO=supercontig / SO=protein_coding / is_pseudo=false